jgi:hypothetical protein
LHRREINQRLVSANAQEAGDVLASAKSSGITAE